jgi:hypothetical protein
VCAHARISWWYESAPRHSVSSLASSIVRYSPSSSTTPPMRWPPSRDVMIEIMNPKSSPKLAVSQRYHHGDCQ